MLQNDEGLPRSEVLLLLGLLVISIYMYATSYDYPPVARTFPQVTAAVTIAGSALLLTQNYLPGPLRKLAKSSTNIADVKEEELTHEQEQPQTTEPTVDRPLNNSIFMTLLTSIYVLIGLSIGFIWITPLFTAIYLLWFEIRWYIVAFLAALSYGICLVFLHVLNFNIDVGYLL